MNDQNHFSVAFECAQNSILDLMELCLYEASLGTTTDARRAELRAERSRLLAELSHLRFDDHAEATRICREYGDRVRNWRRATADRVKAP